MAKNSKSLRSMLLETEALVRKNSQVFIASQFAPQPEHPHFVKMQAATVEVNEKSTILIPPTTRAAKSAAGGLNVGFRAGYTPAGNIAFYGKSAYDAVLFRKGIKKFGFEEKDLGAVVIGGTYRTAPDTEAIMAYIAEEGAASRDALVEYLIDEEIHRTFKSRFAYVYDEAEADFVRCWITKDGALQPILENGKKQTCPDAEVGKTPEIGGVWLNYVNLAAFVFLGGCLDVTFRSKGLFDWQVAVLNAVDTAAYGTEEQAVKALKELVRREQYQMLSAAAKSGSAKELYIAKRDELSYGKLNG